MNTPFLPNRPSYDPDIDPVGVKITRGEMVDEKRGNRVVPYKIFRAENARSAQPVVFWSHGLGGGRDGAGFLSRHLAAHGYIVVHVQHAGSDTKLWEGKPGHPWDVIRDTKIPRKATLQRFQDVPFLLSQMQEIEELHPELAGAFDYEHMGMSGHSFGALTTQMMAGQYRGNERHQYDLYQKAFKAGILYSPVPTWKDAELGKRHYTGIRIPLLHMTGTDDTNPIGNHPYQKRLPIFESVTRAEQHLFVLNGGDHMIYNGSRGQLADPVDRELHERLIKVAALVFWDAYLYENESAYDWLVKGGFASYLNGFGTYVFADKKN